MQGKFKWTVLIVICLSLIYLAFTNRYLILEVGDSGQVVQVTVVEQGTQIIKYDRWTHKVQIHLTTIKSALKIDK